MGSSDSALHISMRPQSRLKYHHGGWGEIWFVGQERIFTSLNNITPFHIDPRTHRTSEQTLFFPVTVVSSFHLPSGVQGARPCCCYCIKLFSWSLQGHGNWSQLSTCPTDCFLLWVKTQANSSHSLIPQSPTIRSVYWHTSSSRAAWSDTELLYGTLGWGCCKDVM